MPPSQTGIAQYSSDLLSAVGDRWPIRLIVDGKPAPLRRVPWNPSNSRERIDELAPTVIQLGNSEFHQLAFEAALKPGRLIVLHDTALHHGRLADFVQRRRGRDYRKLMARLYDEAGVGVSGSVLRGHSPQDLGEFPLIEDFVGNAQLTIVHSEYARTRVLERVPHAEVMVVPMGVPLPALIDPKAARQRLGISDRAFVIASVTHVNPYKRIDVVIRALRRITDVVPEALLIVAGSASASVNLSELVDLYGVRDHVRLLGYVSESDARLVARAADVCVNLRYPSMGETSASLLRLLGAARPVLITDHESTQEYPRDAAPRIPVDAYEDEMVAEVLLLLAEHRSLREAAGHAAREFIEARHSMNATLGGYRLAMHRAFGVDLPVLEAKNVHEEPPLLEAEQPVRVPPLSAIERKVVDAMVDGGFGAPDVTIRTAVRALQDLRLDRMPTVRDGGDRDVEVTRDP